MRKGQTEVTAGIVGVILAGLILLIGVLVYGSVNTALDDVTNTTSTFLRYATNETLDTNGPGANVVQLNVTNNVPLSRSGLAIAYGSNSTTWVALTQSGVNNYSIIDVANGTISIGGVGTGNDTVINYTYFSGDAYGAYGSTNSQVYNGFDLGSVIPLVLFASLVIGLLVAAFAFARNQ